MRFHTSPLSRDRDRTPKQAEWRKQQLDKLEKKFQDGPREITNDEDLQPMWKSMESRVSSRRPRTLADTGGKSGRMNIKKTDEEMWLREGLYGHGEEDEQK